MTRLHRTRRPAVTLTEVLVALFVMAVGMIALLVMFPLGAQQIAQAIKDERTAQAANNADAIMRNHWRQYVVEAIRNGTATEQSLVNPTSLSHLHYMTAMENASPKQGIVGDVLPPVLPDRTVPLPPLSDVDSWVTRPDQLANPSYPVFVDPYGELARRAGQFGNSRRWVAGVHPTVSGIASRVPDDQPRMPRRTLNFPGVNALSLGVNWQYRYATLQDDLDFGEDGNANHLGTGVAKTGRYNWSWVLQRPTQGHRLITDMTVVVYDQRAYNFVRPEDEVAYLVENSPAVNPLLVGFVPGRSTVSFRYDAAQSVPAPIVRAGQWIMDGTINNALSIRLANFYRVSAVTDSNPGGTSGVVTLDLQSPIKQPHGQTLTNYVGQLYVLRGVSEVFERRQLTMEDAAVVP